MVAFIVVANRQPYFGFQRGAPNKQIIRLGPSFYRHLSNLDVIKRFRIKTVPFHGWPSYAIILFGLRWIIKGGVLTQAGHYEKAHLLQAANEGAAGERSVRKYEVSTHRQ